MKKFFSDFKAFALKGNIIDMAVGVIIGGAFTTIVNSLVNDVFMPFLGIIIGGFSFEKSKTGAVSRSGRKISVKYYPLYNS